MKSTLEWGSKIQSIERKIPGNRYELEVALEDNMYPEMYYKDQLRNVVVDETLANIKVKGLSQP